MPAMCKARQCRTARGDGFSAFTIPDPKKNKELCRNWLRNLAQNNDKHSKLLDIRTFKFSPNYIVCEKHFEPICFQENLKVSVLHSF